jgi:hypothetical protein
LFDDMDGFQESGSPGWEVIEHDGKKVLQFTENANWGQGIDLMNAHFNFQAGDQIKVVFFLEAGGAGTEILLQAGEGWGPIGANPVLAVGSEATLTRIIETFTADRIRIRTNGGNAASVVQIREIEIIKAD